MSGDMAPLNEPRWSRLRPDRRRFLMRHGVVGSDRRSAAVSEKLRVRFGAL